MIENQKIKFDRRRHFDGMSSSDPFKGDISKSLVVGEVFKILLLHMRYFN